MKLSEAILAGCKKSPKKAYGVFYDEDESCTCVFGAALLGIGCSLSEDTMRDLKGNWPYLYDCTSEFSFTSITDANDYLDKTREEIAAEIAEKGY